MLYVSTRDHTNTYTAHRALFEQEASDGGMFVPFCLPELTQNEIYQMKSNSFGSNVAQILNLFFSAQLTGWDVDFCCGRSPVDVISLPRKLLIAELWHNTASSYGYMEQALYNKLCGGNPPEQMSCWAKIAIRISVLFAAYALIGPEGYPEELDVALDDQEFIAPLAAWYARRMGLPIGTLICGSYESSSVWDLIHRGELNTATCGQNRGVEQLIFAALGPEETKKFVSACQKRRTYHVDEEKLSVLNDRIFIAVTSADRVNNVIASFNRSNNYVLDTSAATGFGALQDYRSRVGESKNTMLFSMIQLQKDDRFSTKR